MEHAKALAKLEPNYTEGVNKWLSFTTSRSAAKVDYDKLIAGGMDQAKALDVLKQNITKGVMKWLLSALSTVNRLNGDLGLQTTNNPAEMLVVKCHKCEERETTNQIFVDEFEEKGKCQNCGYGGKCGQCKIKMVCSTNTTKASTSS